jgi:hypothetical protein
MNSKAKVSENLVSKLASEHEETGERLYAKEFKNQKKKRVVIGDQYQVSYIPSFPECFLQQNTEKNHEKKKSRKSLIMKTTWKAD